MPTNILNAGGTGDAASLTGGDDGTLTIQTGPSGSKVNALVISPTGAMTTTDSAGVPKMLLRTAQNTTSGTSIDFTSIPSWAKKITVMFNGVSTNGAGSAALLVQIGAGSIDSSGYLSSCGAVTGTNSCSSNTAANGFLTTTGMIGTTVVHGATVLTSIGSNIWVASGAVGATQAFTYTSGGSKTLSGTLDRIRLTTTNGTDTFDAGSVNILIEGY